MSNKLERELIKLQQKEESNSVKIEDQAQLLLAAPKEDIAILERVNMDYQIHKNRNIVAKRDKINAFKTLFNSQVYTGAQLRDMCDHYDLKCLKVSEYKGKLDAQLASKLKVFETEKNVTLNSRNLFILAAAESFNKNNDNSNLNCIVLYSEHEKDYKGKLEVEDVLTVIHSWGDNFKSIRKYRFLMNAAILTAILFFGVSLIGHSMIATTIFAVISALCVLLGCLTETTESKLWNVLETE